MNKLSIFIFLVLFATSSSLFAQRKLEKESRIEREDVPQRALVFIDSVQREIEVKWYKEESLTKTTFEAKFWLEKKRYSVEFDSLGVIEDVEMEIEWKEVIGAARDSILFKFQSDCSRYKVRKVQKQWKGTASQLFTLFGPDPHNQALVIHIELVVKCRHDKDMELFEYLFSEEGELLSSMQIVLRNSSHLEY